LLVLVRPNVDHLVGRLGSGIRSFHARQCLRYSLEQRLDVVAELCARLDEHEIVLLGLFLALLRRHFALVVQIRLVSYQHDDNVISTLGTNVVDPFPGVLKALCI
jgi:hypothetical protein